jgi:ABC-type nickel/cobalt efflux system permease component RcnA
MARPGWRSGHLPDGVEDEMKDNVTKAATKALESISTSTDKVEVRAVQGVKAGQNYLMDIEVGVPGSWTVDQTRAVEDMLRERVGAKVRGVKKVRVRFVADSTGEPDFLDEFITGDVTGTTTPESEQEHDHDHDHAHEHKHSQSTEKARREK